MSTVFLEEHDIKQDVIVTGEAIELEIKPASIISRVLSAIVDGCFSLAILFLLLAVGTGPYYAIVTDTTTKTMLELLGRLAMILAIILIPSIIEAVTHGRSLGKYLCHTRVVRDDGGIISARQAFLRGIIWLVEGWMCLGSVAFISALLSRRGKRLGDSAAGTYVATVSSRPYRLSLSMPPGLENWASTATFSKIPQNLANSCNSLLREGAQKNPQEREYIANSLASALYELVSPPPPEGTPPEHFIAACIVARRNLEYQIAKNHQETVNESRKRALSFGYGLDNTH